MNDDNVDDIPLAIRRRSTRLTAARHELKEPDGCKVEQNQVEDGEGQGRADVVHLADNPKKVAKRQMDSVPHEADQDETAVDGSSQRKKIKTAEIVKDQKEARKDGLNKVTPSTAQAIPSSSSSSHGQPANNPTTREIKQMQRIYGIIDELKNVPDITEIINDDTDQATENVEQSASAPAMVSEGMQGRFQTVNFYWLDMFEDPESPGVLFIFGKVKSPPPGNGYSSGCIVVKNLNRRVFLLPRETKADGTPVDYMDVYNEVYTVFAPKLKIASFQCKRSKRRYCFDIEGIPPEAEYMEVRYSGTAPALPQDVKGETFSHAFGSKTSLMETFLLEKKLKGPSWLQLSYCERVQPDQQQSWSKFEFTCDFSHVNIHPESFTFPVPTLVLASLQTETVYDSDLKRKVFIFAGVAVHGNFSLQLPPPPHDICHDFFCLINTPPGHTWPNGMERITNRRILKMDSESSMLECLVNKLHELDADVYLDYGTDFNRLLKQLTDLKVLNWSRIGRLQRHTPFPKWNYRVVIPGRLLCNTTTSGMPPVIGHSLLLKKRNGNEQVACSLGDSNMKALFKSSNDLEPFVKWGMKHCVQKILEMNELQVLPVAFQNTCIAGSTLFRALNMGRLYRSEHLMLHALSANNYIVPDGCKSLQNGLAAESQVVQELTTEEGFYDNFVIQLRFNSRWVYFCALTKFQDLLSNFDADDAADEPRRMMQNELRKLSESRQQVEGLMKMKDVPEDQMRQYQIQLQALKSTTYDVMLDCLENGRFHSREVKAYVQAQVLDFLLKVKDIVKKMGYRVVYGNKSSVMIQTHSHEISTVLEIVKKIQEEILQTYSLHGLFSGSVGIYRCLLLLKSKKYAGLLYYPNSERKYKVDLGRFAEGQLFDSPPYIVRKTAHACLNEILSEQPLCDKIDKVGKILWDVSSRLRSGALPLEKIQIRKILTKNPEEYGNIHELHHVALALRINRNRILGPKFRKGDQVSYVLCKDGCPRLLSELKSMKDKGTDLKVDTDYYLAEMIHPVVTEICERIPGLGLDSARVRDALGLGV